MSTDSNEWYWPTITIPVPIPWEQYWEPSGSSCCCYDTCNKCGTVLESWWSYCPNCGKKIETCPKCGKRG